MRQPDHVSPELGAKLKAASLQWEPAVGDWVVYGLSQTICLVAAVEEWDNVPTGNVELAGDGMWMLEPASDCTWLPTTGQLLQELTRRECGPALVHFAGDWYIAYLLKDDREEEENEILPEVTGLALLAVLEEASSGQVQS